MPKPTIRTVFSKASIIPLTNELKCKLANIEERLFCQITLSKNNETTNKTTLI